MPRAQLDNLHLEYEVLGDPDDPPVVLIMGFGMQLIAWPDPFCDQLIERGLRVIRFDNRDIGLSSRLKHLGQPRPGALIARRSLGLPVNPPYPLSAMADDTVGLLDYLAIPRAHIVGASMGGMIAQLVAIRRPDRAASLCSIMSTTGQLRYGWPRPDIMRLMLHSPGPTLEERIRHGVRFWRAIGSPGDVPSEDEVRELVTAFYRRSSDLSGFWRQFAAIVAEKSRVPLLRRLRLPALVIHGDSDPLIRPAAGVATAHAIPGAALHILPGMGHDLRPTYQPRIAELIADQVHAGHG